MTSVAGSERVTVSTDNVVEIEVKDCIQTAVKAMNGEDIDTFVQCFPESQTARKRRDTGLFSVQHQVGTELLEPHFLQIHEEHSDVAIRYRLLRD